MTCRTDVIDAARMNIRAPIKRSHVSIVASFVLFASACSEQASAPLPPQERSARSIASSNLNFRQVHAGNESTCGITTGGKLYCWGGNSGGQLGNGVITHGPTPVPQEGGLDMNWAS